MRYDPFDLLFRRVTFEGEVNIVGPITVQLSPTWIFDSPAADVSESGFDVGLDVVWYVQGDPFRGFWLKAHAEYEYFNATLTREVDGVPSGVPNPEHCDEDSEPGTCSTNVNSMIVGAMVGTSTVFGKNGGFAISGGIGIGVALADTVTLQVDGENPEETGLAYTYYDKTDRIRLLGSLGLGIAF